jgi:threonine/homoserine efflux transporter RhtA
MAGRLFSVLTSTGPAIGALFGLVALGRHIDTLQWVGVAAVAAGASLGERSSPARPNHTDQGHAA